MAERSFVPAAGHDWLLPFYDPLWRLVGGASRLDPLLEQAALRPGHRVLDVGCGTGNLTLLAKGSQPEAHVIGLDPDPKALARAGRKARRQGLDVDFECGFADALPFDDGQFDRVLSSFMFHHLDADTKRGMLVEVRRVLAPEGSLHLVDFTPPADDKRGRLARFLHADHALGGDGQARIPELMREAGLVDAAEVDRRGSLLGGMGYFRAGV